jgi:GABA(A) receptor-associated protein
MPKKFEFDYDKNVSLEKRTEEAETCMKKNPDKIPIIVQKSNNSKLVLPETFKSKFCVSRERTVVEFIVDLRKRLSLTPEQAIFLFVNNTSLTASMPLGEVYEKYKDTDKFLKIIMSEENTFG